jgi:V/A-type H+-transporting ATPase subunit B
MNTLVRGQKLPIFSGSGLPAARIAAQIATQARVPGSEQSFLVIFAAMGVTQQEARYFMDVFQKRVSLLMAFFFLTLRVIPPWSGCSPPVWPLRSGIFCVYPGIRCARGPHGHAAILRGPSGNQCSPGGMPGRRGFPGYVFGPFDAL